jgi:hypothetical protein
VDVEATGWEKNPELTDWLCGDTDGVCTASELELTSTEVETVASIDCSVEDSVPCESVKVGKSSAMLWAEVDGISSIKAVPDGISIIKGAPELILPSISTNPVSPADCVVDEPTSGGCVKLGELDSSSCEDPESEAL